MGALRKGRGQGTVLWLVSLLTTPSQEFSGPGGCRSPGSPAEVACCK